MSDSDSFIEEVTEEVRRDKLYALIRRWGWLPVVLILGAVGGTAWNEWRKAQDEQTARTLGNAIVTAAQVEDPAERLDALRAVEAQADGAARAPIALFEASVQVQAGDIPGAVATLEPLATDPDLPAVYSDLAGLRMVALGPDALPRTFREDMVTRISAPGAPYRLLGLEQRALLELEAGDRDSAVATLQGLLQEDGLTEAVVQRTAQLLAALEAEAPSAGGQ